MSHLLTQCLFCFFAEDVGLLPGRLFERLVGNRQAEPEAMRSGLQALFTTMRDGGLFGADAIPWFNSGLFQRIEVPALAPQDVAALDWSAIDPSIFGTLFERGLDPKKRSQLGAHYTDPATILRLVEPVIQRPLRTKWEQAKGVIAGHVAKSKRVGDAEHRKANAAFVAHLEILRAFRVLDPACGSGNFLYEQRRDALAAVLNARSHGYRGRALRTLRSPRVEDWLRRHGEHVDVDRAQ